MCPKFNSIVFISLLIMINVYSQPVEDPYGSPPIPLTQTPTDFNIAGPENVLVVYKRGDQVSESVKDYYIQSRNIPSLNIVKGLDGNPGLTIPDNITYNGWAKVVLDQEGEIIKRDDPCSDYGSNCYDIFTFAWQYYNEVIATPIANYLNNTIDPSTGKYLKDQIRYIVLCKGIPLKILVGDVSWNYNGRNVAVDALLCLLKTNSNNNPDITTLYMGSIMSNPYFSQDSEINFNFRFAPNHFTIGNWKLSYLVSRLDGESLEEIEMMIDRGVNSDMSGSGVWILDGDPAYSSHNTDIGLAKSKLENFGFNTEYNTSNIPILSSSNNIIGYTSQGLHASALDSGYIHNQLDFNYLNGAIFNTYESFNYYSNYAIYGRDDHGLVAEFVSRRPLDLQAGTGGNGHAWEPFASGTVKN